MLTPPHSHWYGRHSSHSRASSRALPDSLQCGKDPQPDQQAGVGGIAADVSLDGLDLAEPGLQIERADGRQTTRTGWSASSKSSSDARAQLNLIAYGHPQPGLARWSRLGSLGGRRWLGQIVGAKGGVS